MLIFSIGAHDAAAVSASNTDRSSAPTPQSHDSMDVKFYGGSFSPVLRPYVDDVIRFLLDSTTEPFGSYSLEITTTVVPHVRVLKGAREGDPFNVVLDVGWDPTDERLANLTTLQIPLFNHLLGLRQILVADNSPIFKVPQSRQEFLQFKAGQGIHWDDLHILRFNKIPVVEASNFSALFPMLDRGRFDYLPLSTLETNHTLKQQNRIYPGLKAFDGVYIFYPMVISLNINAGHALLAERFRAALKILKSSDLTKIREKHFPKMSFEKDKQKALFLAQNPLIDSENHKKITRQFLDLYGNHFSILE